MNRFRSERYGFELDVDSQWSCPSTGFLARSFGRDKKLVFRSAVGFLHIEAGPPFASSALEDIRRQVLEHAREAGSVSLETGSLRVQGREQLWAIFMVGGEASLRRPAAQEMVRSMRSSYPDVLGSMSDADFAELMRHGPDPMGPVVKAYWLAFDRAAYEVNAALGFGTVAEVKTEFRAREAEYDKIVSSFRLLG